MKAMLTGSRYFGGARSNSDRDIAVEDSPEMRARLMSLGFRRLKLNSPSANLKAVYRKPGIDIQLVGSFQEKMKDNAIMSLGPLRLLLNVLPKHLRRDLWQRIERYENR